MIKWGIIGLGNMGQKFTNAIKDTSNSKIISILVEEALSIRGIFNKKKGKATLSYLNIEENSDDLSTGDIDLQTYKKFLSFLKFQEMMEEYNK